MQNMAGIEWSAQRGHRANTRHLARGHQDGCAAETMADQNRWRLAVSGHRVAGRNQIVHVRGESRVGKASTANTQSGKVEAQHANATSGQRTCHATSGEAVLAARKAVGEYGPATRLAVRPFQSAGEPVAVRSVKFEGL